MYLQLNLGAPDPEYPKISLSGRVWLGMEFSPFHAAQVFLHILAVCLNHMFVWQWQIAQCQTLPGHLLSYCFIKISPYEKYHPDRPIHGVPAHWSAKYISEITASCILEVRHSNDHPSILFPGHQGGIRSLQWRRMSIMASQVTFNSDVCSTCYLPCTKCRP